jgi:hypothetical protein
VVHGGDEVVHGGVRDEVVHGGDEVVRGGVHEEVAL